MLLNTHIRKPSGFANVRNMACGEIVNCESLIAAVQKRPALYNCKLKEYNDKQLKEKLWNEVCQVVFSDWNSFVPDQKSEKSKRVQRRWKSLRECFRREIQNQKGESGAGFMKKRKYLYFDQLLFLSNTPEEQATSGIYSEPVADDFKERYEDTSDLEPSCELSKQSEMPQNSSHIEGNVIDAVQREELKEEIDADKLFLMSLLPAFKKINDDQKFAAKIEILQVVRKAQQMSNQSFHSGLNAHPGISSLYTPTPNRPHLRTRPQQNAQEYSQPTSSHFVDMNSFDPDTVSVKHESDSYDLS